MLYLCEQNRSKSNGQKTHLRGTCLEYREGRRWSGVKGPYWGRPSSCGHKGVLVLWLGGSSNHRGQSIGSQRSGDIQRTDSGQTVNFDVVSHGDVSCVNNWSQRQSRSPPAQTSVFENIANLLGKGVVELPVRRSDGALCGGKER